MLRAKQVVRKEEGLFLCPLKHCEVSRRIWATKCSPSYRVDVGFGGGLGRGQGVQDMLRPSGGLGWLGWSSHPSRARRMARFKVSTLYSLSLLAGCLFVFNLY